MKRTGGHVSTVCGSRFGRKLSVVRGEVEREIQALVSKRDNVHTHHPYHAWDPVPSLSAASAGDDLCDLTPVFEQNRRAAVINYLC